jgi:hypothetical protein
MRIFIFINLYVNIILVNYYYSFIYLSISKFIRCYVIFFYFCRLWRKGLLHAKTIIYNRSGDVSKYPAHDTWINITSILFH